MSIPTEPFANETERTYWGPPIVTPEWSFFAFLMLHAATS